MSFFNIVQKKKFGHGVVNASQDWQCLLMSLFCTMVLSKKQKKSFDNSIAAVNVSQDWQCLLTRKPTCPQIDDDWSGIFQKKPSQTSALIKRDPTICQGLHSTLSFFLSFIFGGVHPTSSVD